MHAPHTAPTIACANNCSSGFAVDAAKAESGGERVGSMLRQKPRRNDEL